MRLTSILSLAFGVISVSANLICEDAIGRNDPTCKNARRFPSNCEVSETRSSCKRSCNACCEDNPNAFWFLGEDFELELKTCADIENNPEDCAIDVRARNNCPQACNACACEDKIGRFWQQSTEKFASCNAAKITPDLVCNDDSFQKNCPRSCNQCEYCEDSLVTHKKSCMAVRKDPSIQCNAFQLATCPEACGVCAAEDRPVCDIRAQISFPSPDEIEYYGYRNDYLEVTKVGKEDEICGWYHHNSTSWGCEHEGDAFIFNLENEVYYDFSTTEHAKVQMAADSSFVFNMKHFPGYAEKYYDTNDKLIATLSIKARGLPLMQFNHDENNEGVDDLKVSVVCDRYCACTVDEM